MDEKKKKQINNAIAVLRDMCNGKECVFCPFYAYNCNGYGHYCEFPINWEDID